MLGRSKRTVTFAGVPNANYADFVLTERLDEVLGVFMDWLLCNSELWSSIYLSNVLNTSRTLGALPSLMRERGLLVRTRLKAEAPMLLLGGDRETDAKWTRKKDIRQNERRLRKVGDLTFERLWDPDEMLELVPEFYRQHIARHQQPGVTRSQFLDEGHRRFLDASVRDMAAVGRMGLDVLRLDGRAIAFQFFMIDVPPHSVILKMPSFDASYARWSPGNVLLTHTIRNFADAGFNRIDFSSGEQRYKYRFTNQIRSVSSVFATTNRTRYWTVGVQWRIKNQLREFRRRHPEQVLAVKRTLRRARDPLARSGARPDRSGAIPVSHDASKRFGDAGPHDGA
jgi:hypothetical protein